MKMYNLCEKCRKFKLTGGCFLSVASENNGGGAIFN